MFESLEARRMLSVSVMQQGNWMYVTGSEAGDKITIEDSGSTGLRVLDNGAYVAQKSGIENVVIETGGGHDYVWIESGKTQVLFMVELGGGNDWIDPGYGRHFISGGTGHDVVSYEDVGSDMYITNNGGWTGYRTSSGVTHEDKIAADVEAMYGGSGNDIIFGNSFANQLIGGPGNDLLFGNGGDDYLSGMDGNDSMWGHAGNDTFWGGNGNDSMVGGLGNDTFHARDGWGLDTVIGDNLWGVNEPGSFDRVYGDTIDKLSGHEWANLTPPPIIIFHP